MQDYKFLDASFHANVASVVLNRPEKANALQADLWFSLKSFFEWVKEVPDVHVVVISSHGKHFCAGIDLHFLRDAQKTLSENEGEMRKSKIEAFILELQSTFNAIERCGKPVIAAIHGQCIGAGVDLIAACDIRYASLDARFSIKEVELGIVSDTGSLQRLPHLMGLGVLSELAYTGREFSAEEALAFGMLNQCFSDEEALLEAANQTAQMIANKNTTTIQGIKEALLYARENRVKDSLLQVASVNAKIL